MSVRAPAHVGRHGHERGSAAGAAGAEQGCDNPVQRLRDGAVGEGLALPGGAMSGLRELQHGSGEDHHDGTDGAPLSPPER